MYVFHFHHKWNWYYGTGQSFLEQEDLEFPHRIFRKNRVSKEIGGVVLPSDYFHPLVPDDFVMVLMVRVPESRPVVIVELPI